MRIILYPYLDPAGEDVTSEAAGGGVDPVDDGDEGEDDGGDDEPVGQPVELGHHRKVDLHLLDVVQDVSETVDVHQQNHLHQGQQEKGPGK